MLSVVMWRLTGPLLTLWFATLLIFLLMRFAPGDPVALYLSQTAEVALSDSEAYKKKAEELRAEWGLDQNLFRQYISWLKQVVQLNLGASLHTGKPVSAEIAARLPATILLSIAALLLQTGLGLFLGTVSALKADTGYDRVLRMVCVALSSTPVFVVGLLLLGLFAVQLNVYEISSEATLSRLWLPAAVLGVLGAPQLIRMVRANLLEEFGRLYVISAQSRGLARRLVVRHAMRNAMLPVLTLTSLSLAGLVTGGVIVESIFSWPGIGKYALDSILLKDYPVIQGYALVMVTIVIVINAATELIYVLVDPRLRTQGRGGFGNHA